MSSPASAPSPTGTVVGSGMQLPFRDRSVDVCYSSNVLEHVPEPWTMAREMVRVTRPGGMVFLSYTVWFGPWGGHETAPWHYLGGARARRRYARTPRPRAQEQVRRVAVRGDRAGRPRLGAPAGAAGGVELVDLRPRYNPWWSRWLLRVPVLREVVTWNLVIVLRRR